LIKYPEGGDVLEPGNPPLFIPPSSEEIDQGNQIDSSVE